MKRFRMIIRIRYADAERKMSGTWKCKSFGDALKKAGLHIAAWSSDDFRQHGNVVRTSVAARELKTKAKKS